MTDLKHPNSVNKRLADHRLMEQLPLADFQLRVARQKATHLHYILIPISAKT